MKYKVYLFPGGNRGCGRRHDKRRGFIRYFISYETRLPDNTRPRHEVEWIDVGSMEEAREARDRRYTELLLAGAEWKGNEEKKIPIPRKKVLRPDEYLCRQHVKKVYWTVKVGRKYLGGSFSKMEARKIRDRHFSNREILKPCLRCGKRPVWRGFGLEGRGNALEHDEPDCPSYAIIKARDISKMRKAEIWNRHLRGGKFPVKGILHKSKIEHLL
ncbi:MAG: hypothetical protein O3A92_15950 [Verrucomicrobia bacterium]|nr:hypothetical protein [Verrucomicrobiota bacterium]